MLCAGLVHWLMRQTPAHTRESGCGRWGSACFAGPTRHIQCRVRDAHMAPARDRDDARCTMLVWSARVKSTEPQLATCLVQATDTAHHAAQKAQRAHQHRLAVCIQADHARVACAAAAATRCRPRHAAAGRLLHAAAGGARLVQQRWCAGRGGQMVYAATCRGRRGGTGLFSLLSLKQLSSSHPADASSSLG